MRKKFFVILGVIFLLLFFLGQLISSLPPDIRMMLYDKLERLTEKTQTIGTVTANRDTSALTITEITSPTWTHPETVIGKAYKVDRLKDDGQPVHVEFAYNPADIDPKIPEGSLRLYKWHSEAEKPFWALVNSQVDTQRHVVTADLTSFSILAVHAPLMYYWPETDVANLNTYLAGLIKDIPEFSCGIFITVDEELLEWNNSEIVEQYKRPWDEQMEANDCAKRPGAPIPVISTWQSHEKEMKWGAKQSNNTQYTIGVSIAWQTDDQKSAEVDGIVRDQKGNPLEGVSIIAKKIKYSPQQEQTVTKSDGSYQLQLHSGQYQIALDPNGKHSNCSVSGYTEKFFEFGELPDAKEDYRHGPWQKDVTLQCSDYYINETVQLPIDTTVYNIRLQGTETHHIIGNLIQPTPGGYGWEGTWEVDHQIEARTKPSDTFKVPGGTIKIPSSNSVTRDHFKYQFTLLRGAKAGDPITLKGGRVGEGFTATASTSAGSIVANINGATGKLDVGGGSNSSSAAYVDVAQTRKIISVDGENGLVIELPIFMSSQYPHAAIKHIAK